MWIDFFVKFTFDDCETQQQCTEMDKLNLCQFSPWKIIYGVICVRKYMKSMCTLNQQGCRKKCWREWFTEVVP